MTPQALGDLLHRRQAVPHAPSTSAGKKLPSSSRVRVVPKLLEQFPEQMSPNALEVVLKELLQLDLLVADEVLTPLE